MEAFGAENCIGTYSNTKTKGMIPFDSNPNPDPNPNPNPSPNPTPNPNPNPNPHQA